MTDVDTGEAFFRLRAGVVARSAGANAVKRAAYQAAESFTDAGTGEVFDFTHKRAEVQHTEILTPAGAPDWARDARQLWNRAERSERRGDAQVARMLDFAIPREVPEDQRAEFCRYLLSPYVEQGMVVDFAVQVVTASDGQPQPHCSAELTMRRLDSSTETGFSKRKERGWNDIFAQFGRQPGAGEAHLPAAYKARDMRADFAARANQWLSDNRIDKRVDLRSNAAKQVERSTQPLLPKWVVKHTQKYPRHKWCQRARAHVEELETWKKQEAQLRLYIKNLRFEAGIHVKEMDRLRQERAAEITTDETPRRGFARPTKDHRPGLTWHVLGSPLRPPGIDIERVTLRFLDLRGGQSIQDIGDGWLLSEAMTPEAALLMVAELQARGADRILVEGDPEAKQMLWRAAILRGMQPDKIQGYVPTRADLEWADVQPPPKPVQSAPSQRPAPQAVTPTRARPAPAMPQSQKPSSQAGDDRKQADEELEREARKVLEDLEAELKPGGPAAGPK